MPNSRRRLPGWRICRRRRTPRRSFTIRIWKKSCGRTPRIGKSRSRTAGAERAVVETRIQSRELRKQASEEGIGIKNH